MARILRLCHNYVESMLRSALYQEILSIFPYNMQMAFAYGSAVFQQGGHRDKSQNMLDFIFVVDDPLSWHRENIKRNPKHYSALRWLGAGNITRIQEHGAGVYYNTLVPYQKREIKYGVISTKRLISDLLDWDALYISGRLHKPVRLLRLPQNADLAQALQINLASSLHAALLILPEKFTEVELYMTITGLSYEGDFRMKVGEDQDKIANIVNPNVMHFRRMFEPFLQREEHIFWNRNSNTFEQNPNHVTNFHHLNMLPKVVQEGLLLSRYTHGRYIDMEEMIRMLAFDSHCGEIVQGIIASIISSSSWMQSLKGIMTAGLTKSVRYSARKVKKAVTSRRQKLTGKTASPSKTPMLEQEVKGVKPKEGDS